MNDRQFLIAAYVAPPPPCQKNGYDDSLMEKGYQRMKEAGFHYSYGYYEKMPEDELYVNKALELSLKYGIQYLVSDSSLSKEMQDMEAVRKRSKGYQGYLSFAGHQIWDEPGLADFAKLSVLQKQYKEIFPDKLFYVNLQPIYSPACYLHNGMWTEETKDRLEYEKYLTEYIRMLQPEFLSFDFYPMVTKGIHPDYYKQLSIVRRICKKEGIPFWVYIQSCTWNREEARIPSGNEMLWQINTSVAYGARGIQYFCFFTPYSNSAADYNVALLDFYGNPTDLYDYAKRANLFLRAVEREKEFFQAKNIGMIKNGQAAAAVAGEEIICPQRIRIEKINGDLLIGVYKYKQTVYLYVVSDRTGKEQEEITIEFAEGITGCMIREKEPFRLFWERAAEKLEGGEAMLLTYEIKGSVCAAAQP